MTHLHSLNRSQIYQDQRGCTICLYLGMPFILLLIVSLLFIFVAWRYSCIKIENIGNTPPPKKKKREKKPQQQNHANLLVLAPYSKFILCLKFSLFLKT